MKVLQLVTSPRPFFDQQVSALERRGVDCTVCAVPGAHSGDSGRSAADYVRYYPAIIDTIRSEEFDLVHANYGLVAPFALAQPTRPVVMTLWGSDLMSDKRWLRSISRFGARRAAATIVPSEPMSRELETEHELIPFGVDTTTFHPIPQEDARERIGWESEDPIALFPYDRTRDVKDFERARRLVDAVEADLELRPVSGVDHDMMPYYMNASDALLVTSRRESGPMVVKEAAACRLPVISTDVGFVRETIADASHCVVSDDDDRLRDGLESVATTRARSNGRAVVDGLGLESLGENLLGVYRRVLDHEESAGTQAGVSHGV